MIFLQIHASFTFWFKCSAMYSNPQQGIKKIETYIIHHCFNGVFLKKQHFGCCTDVFRPDLRTTDWAAETKVAQVVGHWAQSVPRWARANNRKMLDLPCGNLTVCHWKYPMYCWFTYSKWWFSIVMLIYQGVSKKKCDLCGWYQYFSGF